MKSGSIRLSASAVSKACSSRLSFPPRPATTYSDSSIPASFIRRPAMTCCSFRDPLAHIPQQGVGTSLQADVNPRQPRLFQAFQVPDGVELRDRPGTGVASDAVDAGEGPPKILQGFDKIVLFHDRRVGVLDEDVPRAEIGPGGNVPEEITIAGKGENLFDHIPRERASRSPLPREGADLVLYRLDRVDVLFDVGERPALEPCAFVDVAELAFVPGAISRKAYEKAVGLAGRSYGPYLVTKRGLCGAILAHA